MTRPHNKSPLRSKTLWFSLALTVLGVIEQHLELLKPLLDEYYGLVFVMIGVLVAALRQVTHTPLTPTSLFQHKG